jgi:hypothetical protein
MSQNNLNRILRELRAERNRLRAAEAQGGAGLVSAANLNRQIAEMEQALGGATRSHGSPPRRKRRRGENIPNLHNYYVSIPYSPPALNRHGRPVPQGNNLGQREKELKNQYERAMKRVGRTGWMASILVRERKKKRTEATKAAKRGNAATAAQLRANANRQEKAAESLRRRASTRLHATSRALTKVYTTRRRAITKTRPPRARTPTPSPRSHARYLEGEGRRAAATGKPNNLYNARRMAEQLNNLRRGVQPARRVSFNLTIAPNGRRSNAGNASNSNESVGNKNANKH